MIHVVDHGRIVESGDHDALLGQGGVYAELYHEQFGDGEIETTCADGTVFSDGRCEFFGQLSDAAKAEIFAARGLVSAAVHAAD